MKKLMILGIIAGAMAIFGVTQTAQADHCYNGSSYYGGGYSYAPQSYYYSSPRPSYNYYYSRPRTSVGYYSPGFSISIGSGYRGNRGYGYGGGYHSRYRSGRSGHSRHHHHH